jgi:hypothetical protein
VYSRANLVGTLGWSIRLADLLIEVENDLGFSVHFQQPGEQVDPGEVCALLAAILAHGCNLGLYTMEKVAPDIAYRRLKESGMAPRLTAAGPLVAHRRGQTLTAAARIELPTRRSKLYDGAETLSSSWFRSFRRKKTDLQMEIGGRTLAVMGVIGAVAFVWYAVATDPTVEQRAREAEQRRDADGATTSPAPVAQSRTLAQAVGACGGAIRESLRESSFRIGNTTRPTCTRTDAGGFSCLGSAELENVGMTGTYRCNISPNGNITLEALGLR